MPIEDLQAEAERRDATPRFLVHEFFVDFLGGLVPGILFVVATSFAIVPPLWALMTAIANERPTQKLSEFLSHLLAATQNTPNMIWIASFIFVLIFSYILGHVFYRRDPKKPDFRSFKRISQNPYFDNKRWHLHNANEKKWKRDSFACITEDDCQFPYAYLHDYLAARGHSHLVRLLTWQDDASNRSKTFINRLKIRLEFHFPHKYRRIIRNEAHVRLATSTWYVGRALFFICFAAILVALSAIGVSWARSQLDTFADVFSWYTSPLVCPILVFILAWYCRRSTEYFIHYQRLREAFYVLELAYTAFRDNPELLQSPEIDF